MGMNPSRWIAFFGAVAMMIGCAEDCPVCARTDAACSNDAQTEDAANQDAATDSGPTETLCEMVCDVVEAAPCTGLFGWDCPAGCAAAHDYWADHGCEAEVNAYLTCITTSEISCETGVATAIDCLDEIQALTDCGI